MEGREIADALDHSVGRRRHRVGPRGQGVVELALSALLMVTVLIVGIYLCEVAFLNLKVQEAANAAMWESTGRSTSDFSNAMAGGRAIPRI